MHCLIIFLRRQIWIIKLNSPDLYLHNTVLLVLDTEKEEETPYYTVGVVYEHEHEVEYEQEVYHIHVTEDYVTEEVKPLEVVTSLLHVEFL